MGDSSNAHVAARRLSKPRTIKSSSNLLIEQPTTPSSPRNSDLDYFGSDAVVVNSHGERRSRSRSRGRIKAYLYGSSHEAVQTSSDDEETQIGLAGAARDVRKRLSRTGSSIMTLQSAKVSGTRLSNSPSSGLLSTRSTESQGMDPEESAIIADQIKQRAYQDSLAAQNHVSTPVDEDKHVDSVMAPLRRKSLYMPGIATRNASDILRKPPKPSTDREYYYNPSRPEISPLSHLASLSRGEDGRSTPCDLDYSQLGGLQLGTLRVTNGASSPVPWDRRSPTPESKTHDEYYTASEGSVTGDKDKARPLPPRGWSPLKHESKVRSSMGVDNQAHSSSDKSPPIERESSNESFPFSRESADQASRFEGQATDQSARFSHKLSSDAPDLEEVTLDESFPFKRRPSKNYPIKATDLNNPLPLENEVPNTPFSFDNGSPNEIMHFEGVKSKESFQKGSLKNCRVDGETLHGYFPTTSEISSEVMRFEGDTLSESFSSETRSFRCDSVPGRKTECLRFDEKSNNGASDIADEYLSELQGSPFSHQSLGDRTVIRPQSRGSIKETRTPFIDDVDVQHGDSGSGSSEEAFQKLTLNGNMSPTWKPGPLSVPPSDSSKHSATSEMPQADSGYCSYASLRGVSADEVCPNTNVTAAPEPQTVETVRYSARSSFRAPIRKLKKQRPKSQPPPVNLITGHHELTDANIPRIPSIIAARHANRLSRFPLLEHTFPSSQHTTANGALSPVQAHDAPIRFPSPANVLEAASAPLGSFPTDISKPQATTVAVDEDDWGASDLVRSPSWSGFGGGRKRKEQKKQAKEKKGIEKRLLKNEKEAEEKSEKGRKDENKKRFARSRSASRTRARSSGGQSRHDKQVTIADFGTVTESLGNSPYDIAKPTFPSPHIARNWHPHQISTTMPRAEPSLGVRARAQTMFLDMPSVPAIAAIDLKAHNLEWARNRQRSQTPSAARVEPFHNRSGIPGRVVRPHGATMDTTPPVPALPSANQVKQREAEIIRSRPHSMIVEAPVPTQTSREIEGETAIPHSSEPGTGATPRKTKGSKIVPDLWSNGSIERKSPKTVEGSRQASNGFIDENDKAIPTIDNLWGIQSNAWSQRRKSAAEALLRNQVRDVLDSQKAATPGLVCGHNEVPTSLRRAFTSGTCQTFTPTPSHLGPFPNPLASHPQSTAQQPSSASNMPVSHSQSATQQGQWYRFSPMASRPRPCVSAVSSFQHENQPPTFTLHGSKSQPFQIQRKRVGSGPSMIGAEFAIGSCRYERGLV